MGGWCKERYDKDENNKLEGLHQKPYQVEETRWEGQNFSEVVAPQEEEEEEEEAVTKIKVNAYPIGATISDLFAVNKATP